MAVEINVIHCPLMPNSITNFINKVICADALQALQGLPDESIDCVVTSPPYWGLRDYGVPGQIGLEKTHQEYLSKLLAVFDEIKRVLKPSGTCWVNIGDTYFGDSPVREDSGEQFCSDDRLDTNADRRALRRNGRVKGAAKKKCLAQIPARFAIEMTRRGWILRNEIIWWKPNCMPQSVTDRFTVDFEKLFFFVKQRRYYFEQQHEPLIRVERLKKRLFNPLNDRKRIHGDKYIAAINPKTAESSRLKMLAQGRNKRCVWHIGTKGFKDAHFAVFPPALIEIPIKAGCPPNGIVLDPFMGSGTTAVVARRLNRNFIGVDLSAAYARMARERLAQEVL